MGLEQALGPRDLKLGMHCHHSFGNNLGWVPPGHTSSSGYARLIKVGVQICEELRNFKFSASNHALCGRVTFKNFIIRTFKNINLYYTNHV